MVSDPTSSPRAPGTKVVQSNSLKTQSHCQVLSFVVVKPVDRGAHGDRIALIDRRTVRICTHVGGTLLLLLDVLVLL